MITIGADPEVFITGPGNVIANAMDVVPGTKEKPVPLCPEKWGDQFTIQSDNIMAEYTILPKSSGSEFSRLCVEGWYAVMDFVNRKGFALDHRQVVEVPGHLLTDKRVHVFGCDPDFDAYTGGQERTMKEGLMGNYRTAGGHIHIGTDKGFKCPDFIVALLCDVLLTFPKYKPARGEPENLTLDHFWYRQPGLYRPKPYGIEYRSLSNYWVFDGMHAETLGQNAITVGKFCEVADPKLIRETVDDIDWVLVRNVILGLATPKEHETFKRMREDLRLQMQQAITKAIKNQRPWKKKKATPGPRNPF